MQILDAIVYSGPNRWSKEPVFETRIEFNQLGKDLPDTLSQLVNRLHKEAGVTTAAIQPIATESATVFVLLFEFEEVALLKECLETAIKFIETKPNNTQVVAAYREANSNDFDTTSERKRLLDFADQVRLGPSSQAILRAATARGIPFHRLNQGSLVQLGEGAYQRRTWTAETDATSAIAETIASDKQLTRSMLAAVGVNVPQGRSVENREDAWQAAQEIGLPVVVKPCNGNHACGVSLDLVDREAVLVAYDWACEVGSTTNILVEQYILGDHHRLLVIGDDLVAAAKGQREYVFGDGVQSVTELVDELNRDPRRGENYTDQLDIVIMNESAAIVLRKQGLTFESVPSENQKVLIRHVGDLIEDCTAQVHPATRQTAVLAAKVIGLDIAGMDVVATDISRPLSEQRGCIIEVNAGPSLSPHVAPLIGSPQPVGEAVVNLLFPENRPSQVPTILLVNDCSTTEAALPFAESLGKMGFKVGIVSEANPSANETESPWPLNRCLKDFHSLLMHPFLTAMIIECSADEIAARGTVCSHVEFVVVPDWFSSNDTTKEFQKEIKATLDTIGHLLVNHGLLLVKSNQPLNPNSVSDRTGIPVSQIKMIENDMQAVEVVIDSLGR